MKPLCVDLFCGLGGWADGFLAEGYRVIGFDIERHDYGTGGYPGQLVLQDVLTLHGSQFRNAAVIVASPPCQFFSRMAMPFSMPWSRDEYERRRDLALSLVNACFRIQQEASEAAGHHIPLVVENVRGLQKWFTRSRFVYGSFHLWGDIPALMPQPLRARKNSGGHNHPGKALDGRKHDGQGWRPNGTLASNNRMVPDGIKRPGRKISAGFNNWPKDADGKYILPDGTKMGGGWWHDSTNNLIRKCSSRSMARKAASAQIAKIPFPLAQHIARVFRPYAQAVSA